MVLYMEPIEQNIPWCKHTSFISFDPTYGIVTYVWVIVCESVCKYTDGSYVYSQASRI